VLGWRAQWTDIDKVIATAWAWHQAQAASHAAA
jgi:UDP-glucose 4-epimerase